MRPRQTTLGQAAAVFKLAAPIVLHHPGSLRESILVGAHCRSMRASPASYRKLPLSSFTFGSSDEKISSLHRLESLMTL